MECIRVCSWNVNGIRSFRLPVVSLLKELNSHIVCLQETKSSRDLSPSLAIADGYNGFFNHCCNRSGYSGVALFCRDPLRPKWVTSGFSETVSVSTTIVETEDSFESLLSKLDIPLHILKALDSEGRLIAAFFPVNQFKAANKVDNVQTSKDYLVVLSVYVPRINGIPERLSYRRLFERLLHHCILLLSKMSYVVVAGDYNVYHTNMDNSEVEVNDVIELTVSREWFNNLLVSSQRDPSLSITSSTIPGQLVDVFRYRHPNRTGAFTCWSARTGARETNYGVRLDYILVQDSIAFYDNLNADLISDHMGSDHCPVWADLPFQCRSNAPFPDYPLPANCSCYWPQCQKKQLLLGPFLRSISEVTSVVNGSLTPEHGSCKSKPTAKQEHQQLKQTKLLIAPPTSDLVCTKLEHPVQPREFTCLSLAVNREGSSSLDQTAESKKTAETVSAWNRVLPGPKKAPLCRGHGQKCVLRVVKRAGSCRLGHRFWVCARPPGPRDNPLARCDSFFWYDQTPKH